MLVICGKFDAQPNKDIGPMKNWMALLTVAATMVACGPGIPEDSLDAVVPVETQNKVYQELRQAMKLAGRQALERYPQTGLEGGGAEEFRTYQDSLRKAFWSEVLDTNGVASNYGDSIWTKGTALQWRLKEDETTGNKIQKGSSQKEVSGMEAKKKWLEEQKAKKEAAAAGQQ
jgi:hypothetical protein